MLELLLGMLKETLNSVIADAFQRITQEGQERRYEQGEGRWTNETPTS